MLKLDAPATPDPEQIKNYQQLIGWLMWASTFSCPDISCAVNQCAKFMANPGEKHVMAAKWILKYLAGAKLLELTYSRSSGPDANWLMFYANADHAGDPETRKSTTGYVLLLNSDSGTVSWASVRQQVTAFKLSMAEAEYYTVSVCCTDVTYVCCMLEDLGYEQRAPTILYEDNMVCIFMLCTSVMPVYHKAHHIDTWVYHLQELCKNKMMMLEKVSSAKQVADSLTKGMPGPTFVKHCHCVAMKGHSVSGAGPSLTYV